MSRTPKSPNTTTSKKSEPITTTKALAAVVERYQSASFLAVDTEFMREKTYYPQLCLIQISDGKEAVCIDPLAKGLELDELWNLLRNEAIIKVFHAAHQDLEIFLNLMGDLPRPVYDTQIAAMVMGQGDQVGYDKLVKAVLDHDIDKTSRFTDWSKRPLSDRQIAYALDDVIFLAQLYPIIIDQLDKQGRVAWLADEFDRLASPDTYRTIPENAWKRIKIRHMKPPALLRLMHLAAWREREAQTRNLPRNRIVRDETLIDLAGSNPENRGAFSKIRNFPGGTDGKLIDPVLKVLAKAATASLDDVPVQDNGKRAKRPPVAIMELLRVLLKHVTDDHGIAPRLIASADDLEALALDDNAPIRALDGWRRDIFGTPALKLKNGKTAIAIENKKIRLIDL
ncbi:MAG: ribonuclease D [Candidatus Puniceispirillaceae bacterium]